MLLQLEKNQEILPSTRDEVLFHCGVSREIPPSFLSLKSVFDTFEATQELPQHTCLHSRGTPRVPPELMKRPGFPSSTRDEVLFSASSGKESWSSSRISRGGALNGKVERNSRGRATIPKDLMSQSTPDTPDSPVLTQLSARV